MLELTGNKARAVAAAKAAGLPVLASSEPSADVDELVAASADMQFPLFVKAVAGGGGRGMRRVAKREDLAEAISAASREADTAFGDPTVFLEQAVVNPRHIEVQVLGDGKGHAIHLGERDCTLQRRFQKVVEVAPAPDLPDDVRAALHEAASRLGDIVDAHGPDAVGLYISGQLLTEDYYVFNKLAKGLIGTNNIDTNSRLCMSSAVAGYKATLGADAPPCSYDDFQHAQTVFITGSNMATE